MRYLFYILLFVVGAIFGSFLCCQARRLREREQKKKKLPSRSICMHCKYQLKWYDNIPIVSWLVLRGRCRKCKEKIGAAEIISEIACAVSLLLVSLNFNFETATLAEWLSYVLVLLLTLSLFFLSIYDGLYGELPCFALVIAGVFVLALFITNILSAGSFSYQQILNPLLSALFYGGIYLVLYLISKGKWVGDGDWILASIIGLALGSIWLSAVALFLANFTATIIMLPTARKNKSSKIHFGPFLVLSFIVVTAISPFLLGIVL